MFPKPAAGISTRSVIEKLNLQKTISQQNKEKQEYQPN